VVALKTLTLLKHPELSITEDSVGRDVDSQVSTSLPEPELILDKTHLKLLAPEQSLVA
jgi:hypothetical protein